MSSLVWGDFYILLSIPSVFSVLRVVQTVFVAARDTFLFPYASFSSKRVWVLITGTTKYAAFVWGSCIQATAYFKHPTLRRHLVAWKLQLVKLWNFSSRGNFGFSFFSFRLEQRLRSFLQNHQEVVS